MTDKWLMSPGCIGGTGGGGAGCPYLNRDNQVSLLDFGRMAAQWGDGVAR
jgi:hypothetical protein